MNKNELILLLSDKVKDNVNVELLVNEILQFNSVPIDNSNDLNPLPANDNYKKTKELIIQGKSYNEIARELGVSVTSVKNYKIWLINNGHLPDDDESDLTAKELSIIEDLFLNNKSYNEIARERNCSIQYVQNIGEKISSKGYLTNPFIKILYPTFLNDLQNPKIGFPANRKKLATNVNKGDLCYVYLTAPVKKVVALVEIVSDMYEVSGRWPFQFDVKFIIFPKEGVTLKDAGVNKRVMIGDTSINISRQIDATLYNKLNNQPDLVGSELKQLLSKINKQNSL